MSKRRDNACIFCSKPAGSREHALPLWLAECMGRESDPLLPAIFASSSGWHTQGKERAVRNVVTKRVCHDCNTGWMGELEADVKAILAPWIANPPTPLTRSALMLLPEQLRLVNRWLLKTACCLKEVAPRGKLDKLPPEACQWVLEGILPTSCKTYAGWIAKSSCSFRISRGFPTVNGGLLHARQQHRQSFDVIVHLNHLAIRMVNAPDAELSLMPVSNSQGELCTPAFWCYSSQPPGTEIDSCVFDSTEHFIDACVVRPLPPNQVAHTQGGQKT